MRPSFLFINAIYMATKSIKINILGRQYPLRVEEQDEAMMLEMAEYVDQRFKDFKKQLSKQNETTIMVMATLSIAEELFQLQKKESNMPDSDVAPAFFDEMSDHLTQLLDQIKETNNNPG